MACRWCVRAAAALEAAYKEVEAGQLEDHPKQAALQKVLIGIRTLQPVRANNLFIHMQHSSPWAVRET